MTELQPITVKLEPARYGELPAVVEWCRENLPEKETWNMKTWYRYQIYAFNDYTEAAMFLLRWGGKIVYDD